MYDNILFPTDGSAGSEAAAAHVREIADAFDATVHVLYVVDARHADYGLSGAFVTDEGSGVRADPAPHNDSGMVGERDDPEETRAALVERGEEIVDRAAAAVGDDGVTTRTAVATGTPHEAILEYADANDVDLVVMGTRGRTGIERYLLGSVTEKVVRLSDAPVVTVRADEGE